ncbi:MAG TPA: NAD(P)H dehydrogenase assembly family protein, partial [Coleofasciculaceae cyanobacterium]
MKELAVGDRVRLGRRPPYLKTADPMPMLRPPDLVPLGEAGIILDRRPGDYWAI